MKKAQVVIGTKYNVTAGYFIGEQVTFLKDHVYNSGVFLREDSSHCYKYYTSIEPVATDITPAEKLGYKVGDKFVITRNAMGSPFKVSDIVTLEDDDGSELPYFRRDSDELGRYEYLDGVKPYVAPVKTPKPVDKKAYRIVANTICHGFNTGDVVYFVEACKYNGSKVKGMSYDKNATIRGHAGWVSKDDCELLPAYEITGNSNHHAFAIGDVVYLAESTSNPSYVGGMNTNPQAACRVQGGWVLKEDCVAI